MAPPTQPRRQGAAPRSISSSASSLFSYASSFASRIPRPAWYLVTFLSSSYFLTTFLISRLAALHERMSKDAESKDGLKKRFQQNQNDVAFTVMALLPTLGKGVNERFDVDKITEELKKVGERGKVVPNVPQAVEIQPAAPEAESTAPAVETIEEAQAIPAPSETASSPAKHIVAPSGAPTSALDAVSEPLPPPISPEATLTPTQKTMTNGMHDRTNGDSNGSHEAVVEESSAPQPQGSPAANELNGKSKAEANGIHPAASTADAPPAATQPEESVSDEERKRLQLEHEEKARQAAAEAERKKREEEEEQQRRRAEEEMERKLQEEEKERQRLEEAEQRRQAEEERQRLVAEQLAADRKLKMELWSELKITAISRALTTVYAVNLLSMLTHVQLNTLGRYAYLSSLARQDDDAATPQPPANIALDPFEDAWAKANTPAASQSSSSSSSSRQNVSQETSEAYLTFSWYFLHTGCQQLSERVRSKVEEVMASVPLKTQLNHQETVAVLARIKRRIEYEYERSDADDEEEGDGPSSPRGDFPGFVPNESKMAMGSESLLPNGFSSGQFEDESMMSVSVMSGSTTATARNRRGKRRRVHLLQYLLPTTPQGDLEVLHASGLLPPSTALSPGPISVKEYDTHVASLLDETRDVLESRDAAKVLRKCINAAFDTMAEALRAPFGLEPSQHDSAALLDETAPQQHRIRELRTAEEEAEVHANALGGKRLKLAAILPLLARQSGLALEGVPNEMLDAVCAVKELKALSAVIYSAWGGEEAGQ